MGRRASGGLADNSTMVDSNTRLESAPLSATQRRRLRRRTAALRRQLNALDVVVSGSVHTRYRVCGKPNCRCAKDPSARHGPYYQWSHREDGRDRHQVVSAAQAERLHEAIANYRALRALLREWEQESVHEIFADADSADTRE